MNMVIVIILFVETLLNSKELTMKSNIDREKWLETCTKGEILDALISAEELCNERKSMVENQQETIRLCKEVISDYKVVIAELKEVMKEYKNANK
jgi:dTDP-glucose pyrophosphorylase